MTVTQKQIQAIQESNLERYRKLATQGVTVDLMAILVATLIDHLIPAEAKRRDFEMKFQRQVEEMLVQAEQSVAAARLAVPGGFSLKDIDRTKPLGG